MYIPYCSVLVLVGSEGEASDKVQSRWVLLSGGSTQVIVDPRSLPAHN